jgi:hypothetical protein
MACVLRASGCHFEPDEFLKGSTLHAIKVWRKGEPRKSGRGIRDCSGMNIAVSGSDLADFRQQMLEATGFLQSHRSELLRLVAFPGIEEAGIDFATSWKSDVVTQTDYLPPDLIRVAGEIGLAIEISHYPVSDQTYYREQ